MVEAVQDDTELGLNKKVTIELHLKEQAEAGIGQVTEEEEDRAFQVGEQVDGVAHSTS